MSGTVKSLIREKVDREGPDAFRSVSLADFLAESGHKLVTADLVRLADRLASKTCRRTSPPYPAP